MRPVNESEFKYEQWAAQLRERIRSGQLGPGDRLPSYADMKTQFGLSRPTVERMHDLLQSEGLIELRARRGAFVTTQRPFASNQVGVFSPLSESQEHQPYTQSVLAGVREVVEGHGREVLLLGRATLDDGRRFDWIRVGGVLDLATHDGPLDDLVNALPPGMPCVTLIGESSKAQSVICDDYHGMMEITEHLLELGHRRIAALISPEVLVSRRRIEGYRQALRKAGIEINERWLRDQNNLLTAQYGFVDAARRTVAQWLKEDWDELGCTAIVAQNDESAIGAIEAFREAGRRVPEHVSVTGFDGTALSRHFHPRLTTMQVPLREIGRRGAQWLMERMDDSRDILKAKEIAASRRETLVLAPRLKVGASSAKPPKAK